VDWERVMKRRVILDVESFPIHRQWYLVDRKGRRLSRAAQPGLEGIRPAGDSCAPWAGERECRSLLALIKQTRSVSAWRVTADASVPTVPWASTLGFWIIPGHRLPSECASGMLLDGTWIGKTLCHIGRNDIPERILDD